jgi:hypothetical protein
MEEWGGPERSDAYLSLEETDKSDIADIAAQIHKGVMDVQKKSAEFKQRMSQRDFMTIEEQDALLMEEVTR